MRGKLGLILILATCLCISCATERPAVCPLSPPIVGENQTASQVSDVSATHYLWGYYLIYVSQDYKVKVVPARGAADHWNALKWLEQGSCANCVSVVGVTPGPDGVIDFDVKIKHPFDNPNLTGFDVRGIPIFKREPRIPGFWA